MEEQKKTSKVVSMENVANNQKEEQKKLSYEELGKVAVQLSNENTYLKNQLRNASEALRAFSRLNYLFKVVELVGNNRNNSITFDQEFVGKCVEEIQKTMTLPEETEETKEPEEKKD